MQQYIIKNVIHVVLIEKKTFGPPRDKMFKIHLKTQNNYKQLSNNNNKTEIIIFCFILFLNVTSRGRALC